MEIKRFGSPDGKKIMLLHGNLMCWRQFEEVIPLLKKDYDVYAVSFDGFDGTEKTTYTTTPVSGTDARCCAPVFATATISPMTGCTRNCSGIVQRRWGVGMTAAISA